MPRNFAGYSRHKQDCVLFIVLLKAMTVVIVEIYFVGSVDVSFSYDVQKGVEFSVRVVADSFMKFVSVEFSSFVTGLHVDQVIFDQAKLLSVEFCTLLVAKVTFRQVLQYQALSQQHSWVAQQPCTQLQQSSPLVTTQQSLKQTFAKFEGPYMGFHI